MTSRLGRLAVGAVTLAMVALLLGCGGASDDSTSTSTSTSHTGNGGVPCPAHAAEGVQQFDASSLLGMSPAEATDTAAQYGCTVRVIKRDGKHLAQTMDLKSDRVNVVVEAGEITGVSGVG